MTQSFCEWLVQRGADINVPANKWYGTPLQEAARYRKMYLNFLVRNGANVNAPSHEEGRTALQWAVLRHPSLSSGSGPIETSNVSILLDAGAHVNASGHPEGQTALWLAARYGKEEIVDLLLQRGANANLPATQNTPSALQAAAEYGNWSTVKQLISAGAEVNAPGAKDGETALWLASRAGYSEVVDLLLKHGANPEDLYREAPVEELIYTEDQNRVEDGGSIGSNNGQNIGNPSLGEPFGLTPEEKDDLSRIISMLDREIRVLSKKHEGKMQGQDISHREDEREDRREDEWEDEGEDERERKMAIKYLTIA